MPLLSLLLTDDPVSSSQVIASTAVLQKPVDCVMAGDQDEKKNIRRPRYTAAQLKRIFGE